MRKITFVCCFTSPQQTKELRQSVQGFSGYQIEWVLINNTEGHYKSAAEALNAGFRDSTADVIVFLHQDIEFDDEHSLDALYEAAMDGYIVGVAGRKANGGPLVTTITDGPCKERSHCYPFQNKYEHVLTCDECVIAMSRKSFETVGGFDETNFNGWHFYGVDLCLRAKEQGITSVVVPTAIWHKSKGKHDKKWEFYENRLRALYKDRYKVIYYPCGRCYTNPVLYFAAKRMRPLRKVYLNLKKQ